MEDGKKDLSARRENRPAGKALDTGTWVRSLQQLQKVSAVFVRACRAVRLSASTLTTGGGASLVTRVTGHHAAAVIT